MGAILQLPITKCGQCLISPAQVGLVTEISVALLLLEQPEVIDRHDSSCHAADYRPRVHESRIIITDSDGEQHVFNVLSSVLKEMLEHGLLRERTDGVSCTKLQGAILKLSEQGTARADMIRRLGVNRRY